MIDTPHLTESPALQTAVIRVTVPRNEIQQVMGPAIGEVMAAVAAQGIEPTGPWFCHHFRIDPDTFDFEVGVPIGAAIKPSERVKGGWLPSVRVARTIYHGGYEGLGAAWDEFGAWIEKQGLTAASDFTEQYLTGPESGTDTTKYRTQLDRPLKS